ncbi:MAG: LamG-like jellyroll fold domain-containing protein, partial [Melioribacteraceae bacterium]|nr:LamG-like jellyroll fold domain-containing protein [Melioribacteraceae bacterium]
MKKLFIFMLMVLFSAYTINAALVDNINTYYGWDNNNFSDYTGNGNDGTNSGTINGSGIIYDSRGFDGINDHIDVTGITTGTSFTINFWANPDAALVDHYLLDCSAGRFIVSLKHSAVSNNINLYDGVAFSDSGVTANVSTWAMYSFVVSPTSWDLYINGTAAATGITKSSISNGGTCIIGKHSTSAGAYYQGYLDEFGLWNRTLTGSEITSLFNSGVGSQYPFAEASPLLTYENINLINNTYTNSSSLDVAINISVQNTNSDINTTMYLNNGSSYQIGTNTQNVTYTLSGIDESSYNIWFFSENNQTNVTSSNYTYTFDYTGPNITVIGNLTQDFVVNFSEIFNVTDTLSGILSCTINATYLENVTNASQYNRFGNCNDTIGFGAAGLYNGFLEAYDNAGNLATYSINGTIETYVYVNFFAENGSAITNYSATIYHPDGEIERVENTNNPINLSPFHNDTLDLGDYIIEFDKLGYELFNVTVPINETSGGEEYNFTILFARIIINLYNDDTKDLITNESMELQLSGPSGYTFNTTGSPFNISTYVLAGDYVGLISSNNYESKEIFFSYTTQEIKELDVYFIPLNLTNLGFVTIEAYQSDNTPHQYISTYAKQ